MSRGWRPGLTALFAGAALTLAATPAVADTIRVRNTNDSGPGSLRQKIAGADAGDTIAVPGGTYRLTSGQLVVDTQLQIRGAGARRTILDGGGSDRVMEVMSAAVEVKLSDLTVRDGSPEDGDGGGISAAGKLVLDRVALKSNRVDFQSNWSGGGIYGEEVVLRRSTVSGNRGYNGGGISASTVRAQASTIASNTAGGPTSNGDSGGIDANDLNLEYSTVTGNRCFNGFGCGGGVYGSGVTTRGSIIAGNRAYESNGQPAGSPGNPGQEENCGDAAATSLGHNLESGTDCQFDPPSNLSDVNARLRPLGNYGGPTDTRALMPSSRAVNAGQRNCSPGRDQRGVRRPQGGRCDIGAFELRP